MASHVTQELLQILAASKAAGKTLVWLSPANREALNRPAPPARQRQTATPNRTLPAAPPPMSPPSPPPAAPAAAPPAPRATPAAGVAAAGWDELLPACHACRRCPLAATRSHVVCEDGSRQARLMFIGEGPGADEDRQGIPFVGRAGQMLTNMIKAMGLDRTAADAERGVYIANIVKCRPPNNRNPEPGEVEACLPYLERQIELVSPQVIVLLGAVPLRCLLGLNGITRERGQWKEYRGIPVMPTFHPAYLLRFEHQPDQFKREKLKVWQDLQQVMQRLGLTGNA